MFPRALNLLDGRVFREGPLVPDIGNVSAPVSTGPRVERLTRSRGLCQLFRRCAGYVCLRAFRRRRSNQITPPIKTASAVYSTIGAYCLTLSH